MLSSVTDLLRYIDENQLTSEFGGTLDYCHSDWIVLRTVSYKSIPKHNGAKQTVSSFITSPMIEPMFVCQFNKDAAGNFPYVNMTYIIHEEMHLFHSGPLSFQSFPV